MNSSSKPLPIPSYLKRRPRCNSYPSPPDIKIISRIKRPLLLTPPPQKTKNYERSNSCPENKKIKTEKSQRKSF